MKIQPAEPVSVNIVALGWKHGQSNMNVQICVSVLNNEQKSIAGSYFRMPSVGHYGFLR